MILKGSQRGGPRQLAAHLLNDKDNDHVTVQDIRGFIAGDLAGAMAETVAIAKGTRARQPVFSLSLNPPKDAAASVTHLMEAVERAEEALGLQGQPRAIVIHEKNGRRHAHVVWSRVDTDSMKAINLPHFKNRLKALSKELYLEHGWQLPDGHKENGWKNPLNFTLAEWQQAKRLGLDPREIKQVFREAWDRCDNLASFKNALEERGYYLARGDRRGIVATDVTGQVYSVARWSGLKAKDVRQKLGDGERLSSVSEVQADLRHRVSDRLRAHLRNEKAEQREALQVLRDDLRKVVMKQRVERARLQTAQNIRRDNEAEDRAGRFRRGLPASNHASFNPLDALDPNDEESVDEAARVAEALVISENSNDPFFDESARAFLKATILHVRTWPDFPDTERNLITVRKLIMAGDTEAAELASLNDDRRPTSGFALLFDAMKRNRAMNGVISRAGEMLAHMEEASPRLFGSVAQVARTNTDFLDSPAMARVLASSVFKLSELKTNPRGTSLYITLPQRYMETHSRWLRMMTTLVVTEMERVEMQPACGHPVLMLLDEFPALKRMRVLENAAAQIAGFGVKLVFVTQTLAQLKDLYKDNWETLVANAGVKLFFCNDDNFTREYISRSIGEREIVRNVASISESLGSSQSNSTSVNSGSSVSFSHTGNNLSSGITVGRSTGASQSFTDGSSFSQTRGISQTLHKRALITPDEVGRLFGNPDSMRAIALVSGYQPMALVRTPYFRESALSACYDKHRAHKAPPPKQVIWRIREEQREQQTLAEFAAQRKAENDRILHNNRIRDRMVAQQREAFIARCVRIGVAAVVAPPLCIGLWGFVAMLFR